MTKLEEVAKAIYGCEYDSETSPLSGEHIDIKKLLRDQARAAVKSLKLEVPSHAEKPYAHMRAILWNDQIDAVLNEEQK